MHGTPSGSTCWHRLSACKPRPRASPGSADAPRRIARSSCIPARNAAFIAAINPFEETNMSSDATRSFDVVIVGAGAGGCAAAYQLATAGLRVALVEKGRDLPRDASTLDFASVVHQGR